MRTWGLLSPVVQDPSGNSKAVCSSSCHSPFFLACEMRSAALLLITLVTYRGQLVWLAIVMARKTASASSWKRERHTAAEEHWAGRKSPYSSQHTTDSY